MTTGRAGIASALGFALAFAPAAASAEWLHAQVAVQTDYVFVGEPFLVKVRALGSVLPSRPDLSGVRDFDVEFLKKEWNPSRGDTTFLYRFRATRAGTFHIPPITVSGGGISTETPRVTIRAQRSEEAGGRLHAELSARECYVGQEVRLRLTLEFQGEGYQYEFDAPFLHDERLRAVLPTSGFVLHPAGGQTRVRVNRRVALGEIEVGDGKRISVDALLIPFEAGVLDLGAATAGARLGRPGAPRQQLFVRSAPLALRVRELPAEGRPNDFTGLVGRYHLEASTTTADAQLGEPLTLELTVSGPRYLADIHLPPLERLGDWSDFRTNPAVVTPQPGAEDKVFRYTVRARHAGVQEIPSLALNFFDPVTRRYETARTDAIPLRIEAARVLTAGDAEGSKGQPPRPAEPSDYPGGIAHNIAGPDVLASRSLGLDCVYRSPLLAAAIALPPLIFLLFVLRRKSADH